ncbi:transglycosylase domain-containing protein [bacterium]|nr:transglycosylase domain-containing protein [candidate division CSSED10-310 bacterium]
MKIAKLIVILLGSIICGLCLGSLLAVYTYFSEQLPELDAAVNYRPALVTHIYDQRGFLLAELSEEYRIPVTLPEIAPAVINAVIATEDQTFYGHRGLDVAGIVRAFWRNLLAGEIVQGGSTLTQQLAKSLFLTYERRYERKIKEAILAYRLEKELTKDRILELYLNQVYFGSGAYGIEAASRRYFSKSASDLSLAEAAVLAGLPKAPSQFSPLRNPDLAKERRNIVLQRMVEQGFISENEAQQVRGQALELNPDKGKPLRAPYFVEIIRRKLEETYGNRMLYRSGWDIYTSLIYDYQEIAEQAVRQNLYEIEKKRRSWKGPVEGDPAQSPPELGKAVIATITGVSEKELTLTCGGMEYTMPFKEIWIKNKDLIMLKPGDLVSFVVREYTEDRATIKSGWIVQEPEVDAALVSMSVESGEVLAWVGGYSFWRSQFDRVTQSRRQPGSAFKPFIYAQALDTRFTAADVIYDTPIVVEKTWKTQAEVNEEILRQRAVEAGILSPEIKDSLNDIEFWKPQNYSEEFFGATTLREGLAKSRNIVSIHLLRELGPENVVRMVRRLGITSPMYESLSLALGTSEVTLLDITQAYGAFANAGIRSDPLMIRRIVDRDRHVIRETYPALRAALRPDTAYLTTSLLTAVITEGTGFSAHELGYPLAGKTGTTNNYFDAWFIGFSPHVVTGVWVGVDQLEPIFPQATGASAALPIWKQYMQYVLKDYTPDTFPVPKGIAFAKICRLTGKLATPMCERTTLDAFRVGTTPLEYCDQCGTSGQSGLRPSFTDVDWDTDQIEKVPDQTADNSGQFDAQPLH